METQNYKVNWILTNLVDSNKWQGMHKDSVPEDPKTTAAARINSKFTSKIKYKGELEAVKEVKVIKLAISTLMATKEVKVNRQDFMGWVGKCRKLIWDDLVESKTLAPKIHKELFSHQRKVTQNRKNHKVNFSGGDHKDNEEQQYTPTFFVIFNT